MGNKAIEIRGDQLCCISILKCALDNLEAIPSHTRSLL